jgi:hypothetical protein
MSKTSRQHHPSPNKPIRIVLTPREFNDFHGVCAIAALNVQALQQQALQQITAAERPKQQALARLAKKYRAAGLRLDVNYTFDPATHALMEVKA